MLYVAYTMSRKVEGLKYTENYKTRMQNGGEARRDETIVDGFRSLPDLAHFKHPHALSFEHLFFQ